MEESQPPLRSINVTPLCSFVDPSAGVVGHLFVHVFLSRKTESNIQRIATPSYLFIYLFLEKIQAGHLNERTGWKEQREALILSLRHLAYTHGAAVLTGGRWLISCLCKAVITTSDIGGAGWEEPHGDTML